MKNILSTFKDIVIVMFLMTLYGCSGSAETSIFRKPRSNIDIASPAVVLSDKTGMLQDMTFADILSTELLGRGVNLMDRSTLQGMLNDKGYDWNQIISGQQYFKIGTASPVKTLIIVNAEMAGQIVSKATCRVLDATSGTMLLSMNITNPAPYNNMYLGNRSTSSIAKQWADEIAKQK